MPQVTRPTYRAALFVASALLAACNASQGLAPMTSTPSNHIDSLGQFVTGATNKGGSLFISSYAGVVVYSGNPLQYDRAINGLSGPLGIAFNSQKQLFVANQRSNSVTVYNPG